MKYAHDGYNYVIKLQKGEYLAEAIEQFSHETKIEGAWLQALGAVTEVTLGFYDLDSQEYQWQTFEGLRECVSLTGNLAYDEQGKIMFHLHGVFSDAQFQTIGGHVKDLVVGGTLELLVHQINQPLQRATDPEVGLQTLDV